MRLEQVKLGMLVRVTANVNTSGELLKAWNKKKEWVYVIGFTAEGKVVIAEDELTAVGEVESYDHFWPERLLPYHGEVTVSVGQAFISNESLERMGYKVVEEKGAMLPHGQSAYVKAEHLGGMMTIELNRENSYVRVYRDAMTRTVFNGRVYNAEALAFIVNHCA